MVQFVRIDWQICDYPTWDEIRKWCFFFHVSCSCHHHAIFICHCVQNGYAFCHNGCISGDAWEAESHHTRPWHNGWSHIVPVLDYMWRSNLRRSDVDPCLSSISHLVLLCFQYVNSFFLNKMGKGVNHWPRARTSPIGFFVYPSVKIINVPAVTDANGNLACTTASTYHLKCPEPIDSATFSGINSHVQAYYGGLSSAVETSTNTHTVSRWSKLPGPTLSQIPITNQSTFTMTGTATVTNITHAATSFFTTELSFATPFLYFPSRGTTEVQNTGDLPQLVGQSTPGASLDARALSTTNSHTSTKYDPLLADYGYVPQEVIDSLAQIPEYIKQYPSLASCLPGGPSILPIKDHEPWINIIADGCAAAAPGVLSSVPDLTTSLGATVQAEGCFHPGACAAMVTSVPAPASTPVVALPFITTTPFLGTQANSNIFFQTGGIGSWIIKRFS